MEAGISAKTLGVTRPAATRIIVDGPIYQPHPDGRLAFLLPVRAENPHFPEAANPAAVVRAGPIVDLLAFHPTYPARWATRRDAAEWIGAVEPQYLDPDEVVIWQTPLAWLQAGCVGLVLLSQNPAERYILAGCRGGLVAADEIHATELRAALARPWPAPRVRVAGARHVA